MPAQSVAARPARVRRPRPGRPGADRLRLPGRRRRRGHAGVPRQVRSSPLIEGFEVVYHFRPYLRFRDQTATNPNLEGLRGTEVTLTARTNRIVRDGVAEVRAGPRRPEAAAAADRRRPCPTSRTRCASSSCSTEDAQVHDHVPLGRRRTERGVDPVHDQGAERPPAAGGRDAPGPGHAAGQRHDHGRGQGERRLRHHGHAAVPATARRADRRCWPRSRTGRASRSSSTTAPIPRALDYKDFLPLDQLKNDDRRGGRAQAGHGDRILAGGRGQLRLPEAERRQVEGLPGDAGGPSSRRRRSRAARSRPPTPRPSTTRSRTRTSTARTRRRSSRASKAQANRGRAAAGRQAGGRPTRRAKPGDGNQKRDPKDEAVEKQARDLQNKLERCPAAERQGRRQGQPAAAARRAADEPGRTEGRQAGRQPAGHAAEPARQHGDKGDGKGDPKSAQPTAERRQGRRQAGQPAERRNPSPVRPRT